MRPEPTGHTRKESADDQRRNPGFEKIDSQTLGGNLIFTNRQHPPAVG